MPTSKLSSLWLSAVLLNGRRILDSEESMGTYKLPASPFNVGTYNEQPYRPVGLSDAQIATLHSFLERAEAQSPIQNVISFVEGAKGTSTSGDNIGRSIFRAWFGAARMHNKINDIWDTVLAEKSCRPQDLIADAADKIRKNKEEVDIGKTLPNYRGVRTMVDEALIESLWGAAAMGRRCVDPEVTYCLGGCWHHEWERARKARNKALDNMEAAKRVYLAKRDGEL